MVPCPACFLCEIVFKNSTTCKNAVLSVYSITSWVKKFEETSSTLNVKDTGAPKFVRTQENIDKVQIALMRSPKRSAIEH